MTNKIKSVIVAVVGIMIMLAITFILLWYSNGFESFSKLYITVNGKPRKSELTLPKESVTRIEVNRASFRRGGFDYGVTITPNIANDFEYTLNGEPRKFSEVGELTAAFDIEQCNGYFEIACGSDDYGVKKVLQTLHGNQDVELPNDFEPSKFYYNLTVTGNGKAVTIPLRFYVYITGIEIDPPEGILQ